MIAELKKTTESKMKKSIDVLKNDLGKVRTGRAHPGLLDHVTVDYYGTQTPLSGVANVTLIDARTTEDGSLQFDFHPCGFRRWTLHLLELEFSPARSDAGRSLFYIRGGILAAKGLKRGHAGRLEFRRVPGRDEVLVAVLDFRPSLPWWIYKATQAVAHRFIMRCFQWHLKAQKLSPTV